MDTNQLVNGYDKQKELNRIQVKGLLSGELKEADTVLTNFFAKGLYARQLFIPKGTTITGCMHRFDGLTIMLSGDIEVYDGDKVERINTPFIKVSPPGTQRSFHALEDTTWICFHPTSSKDLGEIKKEFITDNINDAVMLEEIKRLRIEL